MIMITGTVRQSVKMAVMNNFIEQKKANGFVEKKQKEMTPQERMLEQLREQAAQNQEAEKTGGIAMKVMSGKTLTVEEIEYLQQKNPELLKKYREMQMEKEAYKRQLRNCKTKEEVERVRVNKINGYLAQAKSISHNAVIPKAEKKAMLEEIVARITNIEKVHMKFVKSVQYKELPREQEIAKERAELTAERQEAATQMLKEAGEKQEKLVEETAGEELADGIIEVEDPRIEKGTDRKDSFARTTKSGGKIGMETPKPADDDIARKAMTLIQVALTKLDENSYNSTGDSVSLQLEREIGKRIDIKR